MPPRTIPGTIIAIHTFCEMWIKMKIKATRSADFLMEID